MLTASEMGKLGAQARLESTTPEQRTEIAKQGAEARHKKLTKKQRSAIARIASQATLRFKKKNGLLSVTA